MSNEAKPPEAPASDGLMGLQAQLADLREKYDRLEAQLSKATAPEASDGARLARVERGICLASVVLGELEVNATKSAVGLLLNELKALVQPLIETHEVASPEVRRAVA